MRLFRILPVIAFVAVDFTHYLHNQWVVVGMWVRMWGIHNRWRRRIVIIWRWSVRGWWWRLIVVRCWWGW
jgi:formate/nitrite transporter FocA (FNT family)